MKALLIETAANGFIVTDAPPRNTGIGSAMLIPEPHVFETFESLTNWLGQQFQKPTTAAETSRKICTS